MQLKRELEFIECSINGMFKDVNILLSDYLKLLKEASIGDIKEKTNTKLQTPGNQASVPKQKTRRRLNK
jgi:hypothetical protein